MLINLTLCIILGMVIIVLIGVMFTTYHTHRRAINYLLDSDIKTSKSINELENQLLQHIKVTLGFSYILRGIHNLIKLNLKEERMIENLKVYEDLKKELDDIF